jgi:hypothetical protein
MSQNAWGLRYPGTPVGPPVPGACEGSRRHGAVKLEDIMTDPVLSIASLCSRGRPWIPSLLDAAAILGSRSAASESVVPPRTRREMPCRK